MVLLMKAMSINRVRRFPYPTHPGDAQLLSAENLLLNLGALEVPKGVLDKIDATRITTLGKTMAHLPVSPRFGRMLAISFSHSLLDYVITLVAASSVKVRNLINTHYTFHIKIILKCSGNFVGNSRGSIESSTIQIQMASN